MSVWTHVAATIRFDGIRQIGMPKPELGNTVQYDSPESDWDKCNVPCGSEGSLHTLLWENPSKSDLAAWTATIFGDLRDYEDVDAVIAYLKRIVNGQMVRNGVASIEVEGQSPVLLHWVGDEWKVIGWNESADKAA